MPSTALKLGFIGIAALAWASRSHAQNLDVASSKGKVTLSLEQMKAKLKSYSIKIDDPVYGKSKEFDAFSLPEVFQLAGVEPGDRADEVVFTAVDGYAPTLPFAKLKDHKGYLAYQEHSTPGRFALINQGKAMVSPWPFYVIWGEGAKLKDSVPWPYQLVKIELVDWNAKYASVIPLRSHSGSAELKGFALFKDRCLRCHSINLQGGEIGPELNIPRNITEYWKADVLKAFIKDVAKFRLKSKMPEFTDLSDSEIDQVVAYLRAMKNYKIK